MSYGYGGRANPYAQQDSPAGQYNSQPQASFGQSPRPGGGGYNQLDNGAYDGGYGNNVEMAPLSQNGASFAASDPNAILNECREIGQGIDGIDANLNQLRMLQDRSLNETDSSSSGTTRELDSLSADTMSMYRELTDRVRKMKSMPDAKTPKNAPQVGRIDRRLKNAIQQYQEVEAAFRKKMQSQMERQYRIVRPEADDSEVRAAVEDMSAGGQQVFQQAMMQSNRQGQARAVLNAVQDRHRALQKIEKDMIELAQLFQDMDTLIVQQEAAVVQIEQKGEEVVENLDKGNQEIEVAVDTARKTRRKKWYCVGICVLIVVVIVIIVVVYMAATGKFNSSSSSGGGNGNANAKRGAVEFDGERPATTIYAQSKIVNAGQDYDATAAPLEKFSGVTSAKSLAGRIALPYDRRLSGVDRRSGVTLPVPMMDSIDLKGTAYNEVD